MRSVRSARTTTYGQRRPRRTLEVGDNCYKAGLVNYLEVAMAQSATLAREHAVTQLQRQRLVAAVGLIRALVAGGNNGNPSPAIGSLVGLSSNRAPREGIYIFSERLGAFVRFATRTNSSSNRSM